MPFLLLFCCVFSRCTSSRIKGFGKHKIRGWLGSTNSGSNALRENGSPSVFRSFMAFSVAKVASLYLEALLALLIQLLLAHGFLPNSSSVSKGISMSQVMKWKKLNC